MKTWFVCATWVGLLLFLSSFMSAPIGYAATIAHVAPAYTMQKGSLFFTTQSRFFFDNGLETNSSKLPASETYWLIQGGCGFIYGFTDNLEFSLYQIIYQDNHRPPHGYSIPDDLYFYSRLGSFSPKTGNLYYGIQLDVRLPTATYHNLALEPYSSDRISLGIQALTSFVSEPLFPELGLNINLNMGYYVHNDLGLTLSGRPHDTIIVSANTREWTYGLSIKNSQSGISFFIELFGRTFLHKPPITAYTRENSLYFSPGICYATNPWLQLHLAIDIRLAGGKDETHYDGDQNSLTDRLWKNVPNLPGWRIHLGSIIALTPKKSSLQRKEVDQLQQIVSVEPAQSIDDKYNKTLANARRKAENVEMELERIRDERQRMEDLLDRLRKILESPQQSIVPSSSK